jgi:amidase
MNNGATNMTELALLPAHEALRLLHGGELSARELVAASLRQIDRLDPLLHAFITVRHDEVLREAAAIDERHARGERLPLHGLPVALKDNMDTAGIRTTHGSAEFKDNVPERDSSFVARLRRAGALIVGKASTPEFAAYMNTRNVFVGATRNPWNTENSSGGSSGGTAVALATGMAAIGMGTDYGGSVRLPAAFNAIVGLRGTPGLIPTFPGNWPFDTFAVAGPMCRTVGDLDLMLRVISGPVRHAPLTPMPAYTGPDPVDPQTLRVAWSEDLAGLFPVDQAVRDALRRARTAIDGVGVTVTDAAPPMQGIRDSIIPLRDVRTLILHAGRLERIHQMGNELLVASIERAKRTTALDVAKAEIARSRVAAACATFFDDFDILAMPATQMVSFRADQAAPTEIEGRKIPEALDTCLSTYAITMLGWPCMSIPCGFADDGQPVGLQLVAPHGKEGRLVAFAFFLEKALGWTNHIPPIARASKP